MKTPIYDNIRQLVEIAKRDNLPSPVINISKTGMSKLREELARYGTHIPDYAVTVEVAGATVHVIAKHFIGPCRAMRHRNSGHRCWMVIDDGSPGMHKPILADKIASEGLANLIATKLNEVIKP